MRNKKLLVGGVFLSAGALGIISVLVGGEIAKWGQVVVAVGMLLGGLLQIAIEKKK